MPNQAGVQNGRSNNDNNNEFVPDINLYEKRKKKDLLFMRRKKLQELLDEETEEYNFEMISKGQNYQNNCSIQNKTNNNYNNNYNNRNNNFKNDYNNIPISSYQEEKNNNNYYYQNNNPTNFKNDYINNNIKSPSIPYDNKEKHNNQINYNNLPTSVYQGINQNQQKGNYYQEYWKSNNNQNILHNKQQFIQYDVNKELDYAIKKYSDNFDKLKVDDFLSRKNIQDDLLNKINSKLLKINHEINDKIYQEQFAYQWSQNKNKKVNQDNGITNDGK